MRIVRRFLLFCGWRVCIFAKRYNMLFRWNRGCLQYEFSLVGLSMCRDKRSMVTTAVFKSSPACEEMLLRLTGDDG